MRSQRDSCDIVTQPLRYNSLRGLRTNKLLACYITLLNAVCINVYLFYILTGQLSLRPASLKVLQIFLFLSSSFCIIDVSHPF